MNKILSENSSEKNHEVLTAKLSKEMLVFINKLKQK